jgi:hypothetical protein
MRRRVRWSQVVIALALIAALAIASPVFGLDKSIKKAIKKEVSKQIANAAGPAGPPGANGTNGTNGVDGTARAYALVERFCSGAPPEVCPFDRAKAERDFSAPPAGNASAIVNTDLDCTGVGGGFGVETYRQPSTTVRDAAGTGTTDVAGNAALADDVSFMIAIP